MITFFLSNTIFCNDPVDKTQKHNEIRTLKPVVTKRIVNNISSSTISDNDLFGIWTTDPNGPHADFMINQETYYIVDNDGQSEFPFTVEKNTITISFPDNVTKGIKTTGNCTINCW